MEIVSIVDCLLDDEEIKMPAGQPDFQSSAIHIRNEESTTTILNNDDDDDVGGGDEEHENSDITADVFADTKQLLCNKENLFIEEEEKKRSSLSDYYHHQHHCAQQKGAELPR